MRDNMSAGTLEFIAHLKSRPVLWQKHNKDFNNRDLRQMLLQEIAHEMGYTVGECQRRAKNLKDHMRKCVAKLPRTASGEPDFSNSEHIIWPYYNDMLFMKDEFCHSKGKDNDMDITEQYKDDANGQHSMKTEISAETSTPPPTVTYIHTNKRNHCSKDASLFIQQRSEKLRERSLEPKQKVPRRTEELSEHTGPLKDEWSDFMRDIVNDLRQIEDPYLKIEVKANVRRIVEQAVIRQLEESGHIHHTAFPTSSSQFSRQDEKEQKPILIDSNFC